MEIIAMLAYLLADAGYVFSVLGYIEHWYKRVAARCK